MDWLTIILDSMDLGKNSFFLTIVVDTLFHLCQGKSDLSYLRVSRLRLYETFTEHWLAVNKRRLQNLRLSDTNRAALEVMLADGFERHET